MVNDIVKKAHFIGIGGIGMSGIAKLFLCHGIKVSGSDLKRTAITDELLNAGAKIFIGHDAKNVCDSDTVIYSSAIKNDNPEFVQAKKQQTRLIKRAEALAELMKNKSVITVAGSHGKTTTTSLVSFLLMEAGLSPTVAIGGILKNIDKNACSGKGKLFVAEADESDGSFLCYAPRYSIITNIDYEHLDYYKDFKNEVGAFKDFLNKTDKNGCAFCCWDDVNLRGILKNYKNKCITFGLSEGADIYPRNVSLFGLTSEFDCFYKGKFVDRFYLSLGGEHNVSNCLSVIALGLELGIGLKVIKSALNKYKGADRRQEVKFKDSDYTIIDDYAHHPTEIKATLAAIKNLKSKRVIAIFQPHRFSRTKLLFDEFTKCFNLADLLIITDIYPASELPIPEVTAENLVKKIKDDFPRKRVHFVLKENIVEHIVKIIRPNDIVITLGAGDIVKTCEELVERIRK